MAIVAVLFFAMSTVIAYADGPRVSVFVFWQEGCPHCARAKVALAEIETGAEHVEVTPIELGISEENDAVFVEVIRQLGVGRPAVPLVVVGGQYEIGFTTNGLSTGRYRKMIDHCRDMPCADPVGALLENRAPPTPVPNDAAPSRDPGLLTLPWIGDVNLGELSLPLLTVVLASVDGFNPCAMWVLALLIGLLLGVQETKRIWLLGGVFLLATGAMYFMVMAAWLNIVLWLGAVGWIRLGIGALAIGAGLYYLREYWTNPEGVCRVTSLGRRKKVSDAFRAMVEQPSLTIAALGVAALAIAVNLVELACSAGLPAIYTQTLAMHDLQMPAYNGYLLLYLAIFLLDDTMLFIVAMLTLRAVVTTGRYSRLSHLIGGIVLLALGVVMVLRPDLLG